MERQLQSRQPTGIREKLIRSEGIKPEKSQWDRELQYSKRILGTIREHGIESREAWVYVSALILTDQFSPAASFFSSLNGDCYLTGLLVRIQFSSVTQSCLTLCDPMNHSTPGLPVHHQLPEFTQTHVHQVSDAIQPSHPLSSPSPPAPNPSQHRGLFQWVNSSHEVAKVLEFQLQHQSFQWTPRTDLL